MGKGLVCSAVGAAVGVGTLAARIMAARIERNPDPGTSRNS
ncbi:hypothetical protein [Wenjunlia tyrosinilytica]|jgi:hypothetical protein|nr:hypothetical protein [Wenjunlia tyrosinilytica]